MGEIPGMGGSKKPNILLLSYFFPPHASIGHARAKAVAEAFARQGFDCTIISSKCVGAFSPKDPEGVYHKTFCGFNVHYVKPWILPRCIAVCTMWLVKLLFFWVNRRKLEQLVSHFFYFVDCFYGWIWPARHRGLHVARECSFDLIYLCVFPYSSMSAGIYLKKKLGIPLMVDTSDSWTLNPYERRSYRLMYGWLARCWWQQVDFGIATSWTVVRFIGELIGPENAALVFNGIEHGFTVKPKKNKTFTLLFIGSWEVCGADPSCILGALTSMPFSWKFISLPYSSQVEQCANALGCQDRVEQYSYQPREALGGFFDRADLLYMHRAGNSENKVTHISAKSIDYCASGRPILYHAPLGDDWEFIKQYGGASYSACSSTELVDALKHAYEEFYKNSPVFKDNKAFIRDFSNKKIGDDIALLVKNFLKNKPVKSKPS